MVRHDVEWGWTRAFVASVGIATVSCGESASQTTAGAIPTVGATEGATSDSHETAASGETSAATQGSSSGTVAVSTSASVTGDSTGSTGDESGPGLGTTTGGPASIEFCPPSLSDETLAWKAHYDDHFANTDGMRSALENFPSGSGHWGHSYTLRSLRVMYELTGDLAYLHELMWHAEALADLAEDGVTWPAGVCDNTFSHSTVVLDGRLLTPLLRAGWWMQNSRLADVAVPDDALEGLDLGGASYGEVAQTYVTLAEAVLASHESELRTIGAESFGPEEGNPSLYYRFPNSYTCVASDVMPFNYATSAGTAYAEFWRMTGDVQARDRAIELLTFWWNRTYGYLPSTGSTRSRWWGYRGELDARFDPDGGDRPEDLGHADMTSSFALRMFELGLGSLNATRLDQVAMSSKRWLDRAIGNDTNPAFEIVNADVGGEWRDMYDHLPMACLRGSILEDLAALAPQHLTNEDGDYRRSYIENIAEFAYYTEFSATPSACGPVCGDGVCNGPEDCVGCPDDCGPCPLSCD